MVAADQALAWILGLALPLGLAGMGWCSWVVLTLMHIDRSDARTEGMLLAIGDRIRNNEQDMDELKERVASLERWLGPTPGRRQEQQQRGQR